MNNPTAISPGALGLLLLFLPCSVIGTPPFFGPGLRLSKCPRFFPCLCFRLFSGLALRSFACLLFSRLLGSLFSLALFCPRPGLVMRASGLPGPPRLLLGRSGSTGSGFQASASQVCADPGIRYVDFLSFLSGPSLEFGIVRKAIRVPDLHHFAILLFDGFRRSSFFSFKQAIALSNFFSHGFSWPSSVRTFRHNLQRILLPPP